MSEPPTRCRKSIGDIKTGARLQSRDEPRGYLLTALVVSGIEVARARFRPWCGTWERLAPMWSAVRLA